VLAISTTLTLPLSHQADTLIPPGGSRRYYNAVAALDPAVHDFFRLFESPGLGHCLGGPGPYPDGILDSLVAWVETGKAPNTIPVSFTDVRGVLNSRILCPYPQMARYDGRGDPTKRESFHCAV
jgi:hypothetical protein